MSNSAENRVPHDRYCVNVTEEPELSWWCTEFSCTEKQLRQAVCEVGPSAYAVREYVVWLRQLALLQ